MANIVVTGRFIGGAIWTPKTTGENGKEQYTCNITLDEGEEKKLETAVQTAIAEKWNGKQPAGMQNWALRKGDDPEYEASFGKHFVNAKANTVSGKGVPLKAPGKFVRRGGEMHTVTMDDDLIYPGCYVAVELSVFAYDGDKAKNIKPGVTVSFNKMLFRKHGDRLTSQTRAEDAFAGYDSEEADDDTF
jgi:hypothetical protein